MEGRAFQESDSARVDVPNLTWENFEVRARELHAFFETLGQNTGSSGQGVLYQGNCTNARIDWSRYNPDWINLPGQPEIGKDGHVIRGEDDRARVALSKAGANTIRSLVKYLRKKTGIDKIFALPEETLEVDAAA